MKVLQVTPVFYPAFDDGGPVVAFDEMCRALARNGCDVKVLTTNAHGWKKRLQVKTDREIEFGINFQVRYCKRMLRRSVAPSLLRVLPSYIKWADVVHLQSVYNFPTIPTIIACRLLQKPLVWSPDGALQRWKGTRRSKSKGIWDGMCRAVAPRKLTIHATSEQEAEESHNAFPNAHTMVIPHGVPIPQQVRHIPNAEKIRLLYLGRLDPKKGIENLVGACKILKDRSRLSWSLTIAGNGDAIYSQRLRQMICQLGFVVGEESKSRQVRMVGQIIGEAKERILEETDVLILPSYTENFGVVVVEALLREVPVIASTGTPWKQLEQKGCGLWVANDPNTLATSIERISHMSLTAMGQRGRQWAEERFSGDRVGKEIIACYKQACDQFRGSDHA
jgi:glycosyltransferase involved in cell wall biosynthesis